MRRSRHTGTEYNKTINSKQYHWRTKRWRRKRKEKRRAAAYDRLEKDDLEACGFPSPMGPRYREYTDHRLRMMERALAVYGTDGYAHLSMDKHIESNRALDDITRKLTNNKPTVVFLGASELPASSIIGIKNRLRCPQYRRVARSFKKCPTVVIPVDEYNTSKNCGRCCYEFEGCFYRKRFKTCFNCVPDPNYDMMLPKKIIVEMTNRQLKNEKKLARVRERNGQVTGPSRAERERLVSKVAFYRGKWQPNQLEDVDMEADAEADAVMGIDAAAAVAVVVPDPIQTISKSVWHRDITAARLIWLKGHCLLFEKEIPPQLLRPPPDRQLEFNFKKNQKTVTICYTNLLGVVNVSHHKYLALFSISEIPFVYENLRAADQANCN